MNLFAFAFLLGRKWTSLFGLSFLSTAAFTRAEARVADPGVMCMTVYEVPEHLVVKMTFTF